MDMYQRLFVTSVTQSVQPKTLQEIVPVGELTSEAAIQVYAQDYRARLLEALGSHYEACWSVLGDIDFFKLGDEYIKKYPSQSFDLSRQSASFVDFLEFHPILDEFPCLYDLANFEKKFQQIFHAPREESLKSDQLAQTQALEERQLVFKKHLELLASPYNIFPLWQQRTDPLKKLISNLETACYLVLHKKSEDGQVYVQSLSPGGFELLELLLKGLNLNLALEEIKSELSESDVAQLFQFLVADRLIVAV